MTNSLTRSEIKEEVLALSVLLDNGADDADIADRVIRICEAAGMTVDDQGLHDQVVVLTGYEYDANSLLLRKV